MHITYPSPRSEITRRAATLIAALVAAISLMPANPAAAQSERKPNILLILADDLGYSDLGCYGSEIATPNLDVLAKNGLRFTQFYNTARCWPTRGALLTGYYAQQIRRDLFPGEGRGARGERPGWARLLPDFLRPLGYRSYHSGKWHVDGQPVEDGFDRSYLLQDQGRFFNPRVHFKDDQKLPPVEKGAGYYATIAIADHAIECLTEHAATHADRPFFHYLAFTAPHFPLHALPEDIERYRDRYNEGWDVVRRQRWERMKELGLVSGEPSAIEREVGPPYHFPEALQTLGEGEVNRPLPWNELTPKQREFQAVKMAIHAAMIDRMDREIGRVLEQIRSMGAIDNTLILFLSDNGASAEIMVRDDGHDPQASPGSAETYLCLGPGWSSVGNTPFRRHKTWVHEGGIATPFIAHWPRGISARGELRHNPGHVVDIVPTLLEVAGGRKPPDWEGQAIPPAPGKSIAPAFVKDGSVAHDSLWWLHDGHRAVRVGDWKLVAAEGEPWELYNVKTDRVEIHDLASQQPERVRELEAVWTRQMEAFKEVAEKTAALGGAKGGKKAKKSQ